MEGQIYDLQNKVAMLSSEIERLQQKNNNKDDQIAQMTAQVRDQSEFIERYQGIENDFNGLKDAYDNAYIMIFII